MTKKEAVLIGLIALLVIGGPLYVLTRRNEPAVSQSPASNPQPVNQTAPASQDLPLETPFDKTQYSIDNPSSIWIVANKKRPLNPASYAPNDLVNVTGGQQLRSEAATNLRQLITTAKNEGLAINPLSGYRSYTTQQSVYANEVRTYGQTVADTQSARPGTSEHQTGLAIDLGGGGCGIEDCFGDTTEGKWLADNAYKFGFIIRYPENKQSVTGYRYEPWHIRYVGVALATEMQKQGVLTLEEFFGLPAAPNY